jgi:hypothetical protein
MGRNNKEDVGPHILDSDAWGPAYGVIGRNNKEHFGPDVLDTDVGGPADGLGGSMDALYAE